ncbi:MAG TPA: DNA translocase FtsK [Solirubrobacteraceae bacterium]|nr:DNA translocase FtsK [Solirubrobacteraceae bacterium]
MASKLRTMPATRRRSSAASRGRARKAPAKRRKPARRRSRTSLVTALRGTVSRLRPRTPLFGERSREVLALALLACGLYLVFVIYGGWNGGSAGHGLTVALGWILGRARIFAPLALVAAGVTLLLGPALGLQRPLRGGAICLFAAVTLALAAGTLGITSGGGPSTQAWTSAHMQSHGGIVGEALFRLFSPLVQGFGVGILVVFLAITGTMLLTGSSLGGWLRGSAHALAGVGRLAGGSRLAPGESGAPGSEDDPFDPATDEHALPALTHAAGASAVSGLWDDEPADETGTSGEPPGPDSGEHEGTPPEPHADEESLPGGDEDEAPAAEGATFTPVTDDGGRLTPQGRYRGAVTDDPEFVWQLPEAGKLLTRSGREAERPDTAGQERTARSLMEALGHFGVQAKVIGTVAGPHITRYELRLAPGTKVGAVAKLKDDLAYALAATDIRILAPIPGKQAVGVEVPNAQRKIVRLGDVFGEPPRDSSPLIVWLGKDVAGKAIGADLAKMPHLLVAGTTGAGKSGAINAMLCSLLLRCTPHELRLVLVDPKQVELNHYESIPHLLTPVITSPRMAANALANLVKEMESRYGIMSLSRTRSLTELNKARVRRDEAPLPNIVCVIDELADLMMVAPADVEDSIIRLAQKARAVGIHLVLATQSPRVDVITGMIKANVPSRIAFAVSSQTDSRVILDQNGAESLLGQGDMLFSPVGSSRLQRIQGAYIDEPQIAKLTELWRRQGEPELREELLEEVEPAEGEGPRDEFDPDEDPLLRDAIVLVAEMQTASTSMLQRRLRLGYTRAGRMIDMLEKRKVISGYEGSKPRQVLITEADLPRFLAELDEPAATLSD